MGFTPKFCDNFKIGILNLTEKSYDEIIKSPTEQLDDFVYNITTYSKYYCVKDDLKTLLKIKDLSNKYYDLKRALKIDIVIGLHYRLVGEYQTCMTILNHALTKSIKNKFYDEEIYIRVVMTFSKFSKDIDSAYKDALEIYQKSKNMDLSNFTLLHLYRLLTTVSLGKNDFSLADYSSSKALNFCSTEFENVLALTLRAFYYKKTSNIKSAIECYLKPLNYLEQENLYIDLSFTYNYLSNCYKVDGKFDKALYFTEKGLNLNYDLMHSNTFSSKATYFEIKLLSDVHKNKQEYLSGLLNLFVDYSNKKMNAISLKIAIPFITECAIKFDLKNEVIKAEKNIYKKIKYLESNNLDSNYSKQVLTAFRMIIYDIEEHNQNLHM